MTRRVSARLKLEKFSKLGIEFTFTFAIDNLANLASQQATPQIQTNLASGISAFSAGVHQLRSEITPTQFGTIAELGGEEYFDPSIADKIRDQIERNAMTPSVASGFVSDIANRRTAYLQTVNTTLNGLKSLLSA